MIPKSTQNKDSVLYQNQYEPRWTKMKDTIGEIVPVLKNKDHWGYQEYDPVRDRKRQATELVTKARGTILLKYDPNDMFKDGDQQKSRKRMSMWMERTQMLDVSWDAKNIKG
jgi:hypothetical protein